MQEYKSFYLAFVISKLNAGLSDELWSPIHKTAFQLSGGHLLPSLQNGSAH
jgi:hypothetical protein